MLKNRPILVAPLGMESRIHESPVRGGVLRAVLLISIFPLATLSSPIRSFRSRSSVPSQFRWTRTARSPRRLGCARPGTSTKIYAAKFSEDEGAAEVWRLIQRDRKDFKKLFNEDVEGLEDRPDYEVVDKDDDEKKRISESSFRAAEGEIGAPVSAESLKREAEKTRVSPFETSETTVSPFADSKKSPFEGSGSPFPETKKSPFEGSASPFAQTTASSPFADTAPSDPFNDPSNPFDQLAADFQKKNSPFDQGFPTQAQPTAVEEISEFAKSSAPWYKSVSFSLILSFLTIAFLMAGTGFLVFKLGAIHYDDM